MANEAPATPELVGTKTPAESSTIKATRWAQFYALLAVIPTLLDQLPTIANYTVHLLPEQYQPILMTGVAFLGSIMALWNGQKAIKGRIGATERIVVTKIILLLLLFSPNLVMAHPIDNDAAGYSHLGTDQAEFRAVHDHYWHERRVLFGDTIPAEAQCWGAVHTLEDQLGLPRSVIPANTIDYYKFTPAHPCEEHPGDIAYCVGQIEAALATLSNHDLIIYLCEDRRAKLALEYQAKVAALEQRLVTAVKKCGKKCR